MKKFSVRINYKIPFEYKVKAIDTEEAIKIAKDLANEDYENETIFDIEEEIEYVREIKPKKKIADSNSNFKEEWNYNKYNDL